MLNNTRAKKYRKQDLYQNCFEASIHALKFPILSKNNIAIYNILRLTLASPTLAASALCFLLLSDIPTGKLKQLVVTVCGCIGCE